MPFDVSSLQGHITDILSAPGVDLATISAKRVRKRLLELEPTLTSDIVRDHKDEIDALIGTVYEKVSGDQGDAEDGGESDTGEGSSKRKREDDDGESQSPPTSPSTKKVKPNKQEDKDAEYARQLDREVNGRARTARAAAPKAKANGTKRGKKKSAEVVDSEGEEGAEPKKRRGGFTKEYALSEPLAALLNAEKMSRPQVVKHIWDYIKSHDLQNPNDKREIICDDNMKKIFNVEKINMFKMNKALGDHLSDAAAQA
ncbi:SWIB/MDM2 domain-containing protein [Abortiporus biennis]|nr:SWIB/MDM2 domain-containing protein [Abortiporus biennis]